MKNQISINQVNSIRRNDDNQLQLILKYSYSSVYINITEDQAKEIMIASRIPFRQRLEIFPNDEEFIKKVEIDNRKRSW